ncbi:glycoside hydrolase family 3 C-terminal domain-containing protein [Amycolatopsis cynarae]|uniref:glycoside hydrolase family 3 C-terminal domain-containing protein n=1 Tax=Amycolatopsis cynarae TaxID=2995223 RepID=UPI002E1617CB
MQGGGSSHVDAHRTVGFAEGLHNALPYTDIRVEPGADAGSLLPELDQDRLAGPVRLVFLDREGREVRTEQAARWDPTLRAIPEAAETLRLSCEIRLTEPGEHRLEVGLVGRHRVVVDGSLVSASTEEADGTAAVLDSSTTHPPGHGVSLSVGDAPVTVSVVVESQRLRSAEFGDVVRVVLRHGPPAPGAAELLATALAAARWAELPVLIVGTTPETESEGWDRRTLALPGDQDALAEAVLEARPDTVVVVNAGAPVLLPWLERARTVVWSWLPGQEAGHALADVLTGRTEPAGRLPWTLPADERLVPPVTPEPDGTLPYREGLHVGHRAYLRAGVTPAAPFGHGLGWTDWEYRDLVAGQDGVVSLTVRNTGPRHGSEVVQVYLSAPAGGPDRPVRWLAAFGRVCAGPGEQRRVTLRIPGRALEVWDPDTGRWTTPPGDYTVHIGRSVTDVRLTGVLTR